MIGPPFESSILIGPNDVAKSSSALHHAPVKPYILIGQIPAEKFQRPASCHVRPVLRSDWSTLCRKVPAPGITPCLLAPRVLIGPSPGIHLLCNRRLRESELGLRSRVMQPPPGRIGAGPAELHRLNRIANFRLVYLMTVTSMISGMSPITNYLHVINQFGTQLQ